MKKGIPIPKALPPSLVICEIIAWVAFPLFTLLLFEFYQRKFEE